MMKNNGLAPLLMFTGLFAAPAAALADPTLLSGTIGAAPVIVSLSNDHGHLTGWYIYLRVRKGIRLEGTLKAGGAYTLDEFPMDAAKQKKTGVFTGTVAQGHWTGTWRKPEGGGDAAVDLSENHATLADADIHVQCAAAKTDKRFGYTYKYSLAMAMSGGTMSTFVLNQQSATKEDGEQACSIGLPDLKPAKSDVGFLLQTGDLADDKTHRCTIRLVKVGDYIYVQVGDPTMSQNDCRGGDEVMYCSPRQSWADMVVDRKTSTCQPVE
jgi:hypothetical protein